LLERLIKERRWHWLGFAVLLILGLLTLVVPEAHRSFAQNTPDATATPNVQTYYIPLLLEPIPEIERYTKALVKPAHLPRIFMSKKGTMSIGGEQSGAILSEIPAKPNPTKRPATPNAPAPSQSQSANTSTPEPSPAPCAHLVTRQGDQLMLDGAPFSFVGVNVSYLLHDYFPEAQAPQILKFLSESGVTVIRIWLYPGHDYDRAERLLDLGAKYDIRFVVTLVNYYYDKGAWWFDPMHYTKTYLPHVRKVVSRFRGRPEILAWELMNEPNCSTDTTGACPGNMVRWAKTVSEEIKALDPCHLITTGTIRIDPTREHYRNLHALPTIDIVSIHKAADLWLEKEIAVAKALNKPVLIGEVYARGYDKGCNQLYDGAFQDRLEVVREDMAKAWQAGVDGYLLWQYGHGRLVVGDQVQHYCGGYDYLEGDPIWELLQKATVPRVPVP
jgi:hypothetical protein